jgi:predicted amino acid-binding ACT domain protein
VIPGFQGVTSDGSNRVTTLGRGGSDTSAVAVAAAVKADRCDIYTDVDGVYTTDPRIVPRARKLKKVTYEEMLELASVGAKVLQTRSVGLAMKENVRVQVLSSFTGDTAPMADTLPGTMIVGEEEIQDVESQLITGIAHDKNEAKITLVAVPDKPGAVASIFNPLAEANINVDMIIQNIAHQSAGSTSATDVTFTVPAADLARSIETLNQSKARDRFRRTDPGHPRRQDLGGRRRHAQPCRRRRDDVQDARRARDQHPGDHHQRDQGLGADRRGRDRARGARAAHCLWPRRGSSRIAPVVASIRGTQSNWAVSKYWIGARPGK